MCCLRSLFFTYISWSRDKQAAGSIPKIIMHSYAQCLCASHVRIFSRITHFKTPSILSLRLWQKHCVKLFVRHYYLSFILLCPISFFSLFPVDHFFTAAQRNLCHHLGILAEEFPINQQS